MSNLEAMDVLIEKNHLNIISNTSKSNNEVTCLTELKKIRDTHRIWNNPLLLACKTNNLSKGDYQYIFSQYYYYSKNFTKLLATAMIKCDSDFYRAKLSANLWEEGGGLEIGARHSEIYEPVSKIGIV